MDVCSLRMIELAEICNIPVISPWERTELNARADGKVQRVLESLMRYPGIVALLVVAALSVTIDAAVARNCPEMRASHDADEITRCFLVYNNALRNQSKTSCFLSVDEGLSWLRKQSSVAAGQIYVKHCEYQGNVVRTHDFIANE